MGISTKFKQTLLCKFNIQDDRQDTKKETIESTNVIRTAWLPLNGCHWGRQCSPHRNILGNFTLHVLLSHALEAEVFAKLGPPCGISVLFRHKARMPGSFPPLRPNSLFGQSSVGSPCREPRPIWFPIPSTRSQQ